MTRTNPLSDLPIGDLFESLLPDFVLAFAFFTALTYAVLAKRFDGRRPAVAISASIGAALSIGLVWWEQRMGLSIRDLGPLAVGFAVIILAAVMYQAIRQTGGSWAGVGIALGASLLVSKLLGINWPLDAEIVQTVMLVALVVGILAFLMHRTPSPHGLARLPKPVDVPAVRRDRRDLQQGHILSDLLGRRLRGIRKESGLLDTHPELSADIVHQIRRTLPAEGYLTERMAQLRKRTHQVRNGHVARLKETRKVLAKLPVSARKRAAADLKSGYQELVGMDKRLERLDKTVAANEKKIRELTRRAEKCAEQNDYRKLGDLLKAAEKLQAHNSRIFAIIDRSEKKLTALIDRVTAESREVNGA